MVVAGLVAAFVVLALVIAATSSSDDEPTAGDVITDGTTKYDQDLFDEITADCVAGVGSDSPDATTSQLRSFCECTWDEAQAVGIPFSVFTGKDLDEPEGTDPSTPTTAAGVPEAVEAVFSTCDDELSASTDDATTDGTTTDTPAETTAATATG